MPHEILSVKLCEVDEKFGRLHGRIQMSETAGHEAVKTEIEELRKECTENELLLQNKLQFSRAGIVAVLYEAYSEVEQIIGQVKGKLEASVSDSQNENLTIEEKLLLAEYSLDFAVQAANRALLISMEAVEAQMSQQEREE